MPVPHQCVWVGLLLCGTGDWAQVVAVSLHAHLFHLVLAWALPHTSLSCWPSLSSCYWDIAFFLLFRLLLPMLLCPN